LPKRTDEAVSIRRLRSHWRLGAHHGYCFCIFGGLLFFGDRVGIKWQRGMDIAGRRHVLVSGRWVDELLFLFDEVERIFEGF